MKVTSFGAEYSNGDDHQLSNTATIQILRGLKAQLSLHHPSAAPSKAAATLTYSEDNWEVQHDLATSDTRLKAKARLGGGASLTLKQVVPAGKWFLVPNPALELSHGGLFGKHSKATASYDCLNRSAALEATVYAGGDKQHKANAKLSSAAGASGGVRSKLSGAGCGPLLHSAAASYSGGRGGGWRLAAKSRLGDGTKLKTQYVVGSGTLVLAAKHTPAHDEGAPKATVSLGVSMPLFEQLQDPQVVLGVKWDL